MPIRIAPRRLAVPLLAALAAATLAACAGLQAPQPATGGAVAPPRAPVARQVPHTVASPNGSRSDSYYWMRDDSREDPRVLAHLAAENAYYAAVTAPNRALEEKLYQELVARVQQDDSSPPGYDNGWWYWSRYAPGRDYAEHLRRAGVIEGLMSGDEELLLDENALAAAHAYYDLGTYQISPDNRWLAWTEDTVGRRQYRLRIRDLRSGREVGGGPANIDAGIAWANDNRTVLYVAKDPQTLLGNRLYAHRRDGGRDRLLYEEADNTFYMGISRSKSDRHLLLDLQATDSSEVRYADAGDPQLRFSTLLPREPRHEYDAEVLGGDFIIRSNARAPNFRIVRVPIAQAGDKSRWRDVIAHSEQVYIERFDALDRVLAVNERSGGLRRLRLHDWDGRSDRYVPSAEPAYAQVLYYADEPASPVVRYRYSSLTTPDSVYDYDIATGESRLVKRDAVPGGFDPAQYASEFLMLPARDGTRVPVSLVHRRDVRADGRAPLLQYAYGAYGWSMDPEFDQTLLSLLDRGFVYAIAHVRGGAELGRRWYEGGRQLAKRNTFNDFIDVTEGLVDAGWAHPRKVFAMGGSAGGLVMGVIANERPDLYRGIIAQVPFVDAVTTMLDETIPLTSNEFDEWGNPQRKADYEYILAYSPYDNVRPQDYPAMLVTSGLWDSQVQYFEPAKWVAALRAADTDDADPILLQVEMDAGHGGVSGRFPQYRETARDWAFILGELGIRE